MRRLQRAGRLCSRFGRHRTRPAAVPRRLGAFGSVSSVCEAVAAVLLGLWVLLPPSIASCGMRADLLPGLLARAKPSTFRQGSGVPRASTAQGLRELSGAKSLAGARAGQIASTSTRRVACAAGSQADPEGLRPLTPAWLFAAASRSAWASPCTESERSRCGTRKS